MSEETARIHQPAAAISEEALKRAEEMIEREEGVQNKFTGAMAHFIIAVAVVMSLFHLYASYEIVRTEVLRATHVAFVLFLSFLIFPVHRRFRHRVMPWDWALALFGVAICAYLILQGDDFFDRSITPNDWDVFFGVALIVLVLEAMRRATGWIMPVITLCFLLYALFGPYLPAPWTHKGYEIPRLIGHMYMTLDVILMATIPTCLFSLALFAMVEIDVRKFGMKDVTFEQVESAWSLTRKYWFHFLSLVSIVFFMLWGFSPVLSVFWATIVSAVTSFLRRDTALISYDIFTGKEPIGRGLWNSGLVKALSGGSLGVLNVAATCAGAGIIVGVVTLTGLGLKFSSIVLQYAGGSLLLTAIYTSLIVWIVGLALPVTASYIICAVIAAPALIQLGVPDFAAHMFIFYCAVLSEVSPPTALSPFAAAAITGGDPYKTTLQCWKYTTPAFLVPFMFVLDPSGTGLLLTGSFKTLGTANWGSIAIVTITAAVGIVALAGGLQGWLLRRTTLYERVMLIIAGFLLVYPTSAADVIGFVLVLVVLGMQWFLKPSTQTS